MLPDDPTFMLETTLPPLDLSLDFDADFRALGGPHLRDTQHSSQSLLSLAHKSFGSSRTNSLADFNLSSSLDSFRSPAKNTFPPAPTMYGPAIHFDTEAVENEPLIYQDDMDFDFDIDGNLRDISLQERQAGRAGSLVPDHSLRMNTELQQQYAVDQRNGRFADITQSPRVNMDFSEDNFILPEADPFETRAFFTKAPSFFTGTNTESFEAPLRPRRRLTKKSLTIDTKLMISTNELATLQKDYTANQQRSRRAKVSAQNGHQAKKNAHFLLLDSGIGGIGFPLDSSGKIRSPLAEMFSGSAMYKHINGVSLGPDMSNQGGTKRSRLEVEAESQQVAKRPRITTDVETVLGQIDDEFDIQLPQNYDTIEDAREAGSGLKEYSSLAMPWNVSVSAGSHQRLSSARHGSRGFSYAGPDSALSHGNSLENPILVSRRTVQSSPLLGRGSNFPGELSRFDKAVSEEREHAKIFDQLSPNIVQDEDNDPDDSNHASVTSHDRLLALSNVERQNSVGARRALDRESGKFLEFLKNTIEERNGDERLGGHSDHDELYESDGFLAVKRRATTELENQRLHVTFESLFEPSQTPAGVAAQAFFHVLNLATKRRCWVEQDISSDSAGVVMPFGSIKIGIPV